MGEINNPQTEIKSRTIREKIFICLHICNIILGISFIPVFIVTKNVESFVLLFVSLLIAIMLLLTQIVLESKKNKPAQPSSKINSDSNDININSTKIISAIP